MVSRLAACGWLLLVLGQLSPVVMKEGRIYKQD